MYIHFALGDDKDDVVKQSNKVISLILDPKRLKATNCPEFLPVFTDKNDSGFDIDIEQTASLNKPMLSDGDMLVQSSRSDIPIIYLPEMVHMICFISIPFKKISKSSHTQHYGRLGLVFTDDFIKRINAKKVVYYTESNIKNDNLIADFNRLKKEGKLVPDELEEQILYYRKPASLFEAFKTSAINEIKKVGNEISIEKWSYKGYPDGYNFENENEFRAVVPMRQEYMEFKESDLLMILVPCEETKIKFEDFITKKWNCMPKIEICP